MAWQALEHLPTPAWVYGPGKGDQQELQLLFANSAAQALCSPSLTADWVLHSITAVPDNAAQSQHVDLLKAFSSFAYGSIFRACCGDALAIAKLEEATSMSSQGVLVVTQVAGSLMASHPLVHLQQEAVELKGMYEQAVEVSSALEQELNRQATEIMELQSSNGSLKAALEKAGQDSSQYKTHLNKAGIELKEIRASHDKALRQLADTQMGYDLLSEEASAQQANLVQAMIEAQTLRRNLNMHQAYIARLQNANLGMKDAMDQAAEFEMVAAAQLVKASTDAAGMRAAYDKGIMDAAENKASFDAQLHKAFNDNAEMKAAFDKEVLDSAENKASFDAQLAKAWADTAGMKAAFDKSLLDAAEDKASFDAQLYKAQVDTAEMKAAFDKGILDAAENKAAFDAQLAKAEADAADMKAAFDKGILDAAENKATFDAQLAKAEADTADMKAAFDKGILDAAENKATFDAQLAKAEADAAEMKAAFDKGVLDAAENKAMFDAQLAKAEADTAEMKATYDKGLLEAADRKASFDAAFSKACADAAEFKAAFDQSILEAAEAKIQHDIQLAKAQADTAEMKAAYDKGVLDAVDNKITFDAQLFKAQADTAEMKAAYDKGVFDAAENKAAFDAQLFKAEADAAEMKAAYDKGVFDAAEGKATFDATLAEAQAGTAVVKAAYDEYVVMAAEAKFGHDAQLAKAQADTAEMKAAYDKGVLDAAENKATFDAQLAKAEADTAEMKAAFDKGVSDAAESKATFDAQLFKSQADAAEMKAAFDKGVVDAAENKATFDAQLFKAQADAAEMKAAFDKGAVDAQLFKAQADTAEMKAAFDKGAVDAAESKATFDAQLFKAQADTAEMKAAFDKGAVDAAEQKSSLEAQIQKVEADAIEVKTMLDKTMEDAAEAKLQHDTDLLQAHTRADDMQAALDKSVLDARMAKDEHDRAMDEAQVALSEQTALLAKTTEDAGNMKSMLDATVSQMSAQTQQAQKEADHVRKVLLLEQERLADLQDEHCKLLQQRDILQSELQVALHNYKPTASIDSGTPADKMLTMLTELLDGTIPSIQDILFVQSAILESMDIYQPIDLGKQLLQGVGMDEEVGLSLLSQLGARNSAQGQEGQTALPSIDDAAGQAAPTPAAMEDDSDRSVGQGRAWEGLQQCLESMLNTSFVFLETAEPLSRSRNLPAGLTSSAASLLHKKSMRASLDICSTSRTHKTLLGDPPDLLLTSGYASTVSDSTLIPAGEEDDNFPTFSQLSSPLYEEVSRVLESSSHWQFDAFRLADVTHGHPLSTMAFYAIHQAGLIAHFGLRPDRLARFLRRVEDGYFDNPYHNATHAADVVQTMSLIMHRGGLVPGYADPLTHLAALLAAVVHDFEHVGRTNDFLVNSGHDLALLYNDKAPLENHHVSSAFSLLRKKEYNFLAKLSKADTDRLRRTVIELVLATDMKQHFTIVSHFTTVHRLGPANVPSTPSVMSGVQPRAHSRSDSGNSVNSMGSGGTPGDDVQIVIPLDEAERLLSLQMALKLSDLGHTGAALPVHLKWVSCLEEEFFRQGDAERAANMTISALFDRGKQGISKSQLGFYDIVVIPLHHAFSRVFTNTKPLLAYVMRNYKVWTEQQCPT